MKTKLYLISISLLAVLSANANADDAKTFPGANCQPSSQTQQISRDYVGRMYNTSSVGQYWTCPIVRDTMAYDSSNGIKNAGLRVFDNNSSSNLSCSLYSRGSTGASWDYAFSTTTSTNTGSLGFSNLQTPYYGYAYLRCYVPGRNNGTGASSGITSYTVNEDS